MTEDIFRICDIDNTITKVNQTCDQHVPDGTGGKAVCKYCKHADKPTVGILTLLKTMRFKLPDAFTCDKPCLYSTIRNSCCCLDLVSVEGHTEENCRYGIMRQAELLPVGSGK